jgi:predicted kinase
MSKHLDLADAPVRPEHLAARPSRLEAAAPAVVEDPPTLRGSSGPRQPPRRGPASLPQIHLVIGPVGAGKSTFAQRLARDHRAARLTLDQWMAALFSPDRPEEGVLEWYRERAARCVEQIWTVAAEVLAAGSDVVLEIGLLSRRERERFYRRVADAGVTMTVHVLEAARDVRRARVEARSRERGATFSMVVPAAIFELASDLWEPPEPDEREGREVRFLRTDEG